MNWEIKILKVKLSSQEVSENAISSDYRSEFSEIKKLLMNQQTLTEKQQQQIVSLSNNRSSQGQSNTNTYNRFLDRHSQSSFSDRQSKPSFSDRQSKPNFSDRQSKPSFSDNRHLQSSFSDRQSKPSFSDRSERKCFNCGGKGHIKVNCPSPKFTNTNDSNFSRGKQT
ncbi:unnamed protein product [Mytilus edulis]|uniref:CCHC-type domain-containing protein n=1 Tax=Mytilus edulis TaxID=6550 RepID=A0A8S3UXU7_MYTED|nr:unnamed protein product [Mytilus edulis]